MKIKMILVSMFAIAALTGCSEKDGEHDGQLGARDADMAFVSIKIETESTTARSSGEGAGANESDLKTLYVVVFNDAGNVVGVPGTTEYFIKIQNASSKPDAIKISGAATKLLMIANPGSELVKIFDDINSLTTFPTLNVAIKSVSKGEITDEVVPITRGFTMINSGDESGKNAGDKISDPLIPIGDKIQKVTEDVDETAAKKAAELDDNRVTIKIERLASKIEFKIKGDDDANISVLPAGATFSFVGWVPDAVNSTFYPFAEKTLLSVTHTSGGSYTKSFYTQDPNFTDGVGLTKATINSVTYEPVLTAPYTWMTAPNKIYCIENTMSAVKQEFGNATRLVIKGTYYPPGHSKQGDWFSFAGKNHANLTALQTAYNDASAGPNLKDACDRMFGKIKAYANTHSGVTLVGTTFATLKETDLAQIPNGGEVIKEGKTPVIRWYQGGRAYYYYEIRHDNETTKDMDFGKYGVVRNNWYKLTLGSVNGAGTPWYPDIDNPGPGDPDPTDPIDGTTGYLGVTVSVSQWIIWENEIGI
ncbi:MULTISPECIES: Mfa1 family fimbria major subunit [Butyricimonas]|uniref:Mfa1 family fimbria major subunit n=1 Tax=Butyricimonas TaxID=574697 RepID=UPI0007FB3373|nr:MULTISPECIES: Mfa1 family fimbria major subunit [Butyricimonas]